MNAQLLSATSNPEASEIRRLFAYNQETGVFTRLVTMSSRALAGDVAGHDNGKGYLRTTIRYKRYCVHVLIWVWMTGEWPDRDIDHKDGNRANNKWENLRIATRTQNMGNSKRRPNSLHKGVTKRSDRQYVVKIQRDRVGHYVGSYPTLEQASEAYRNAAERLFGEFARTA